MDTHATLRRWLLLVFALTIVGFATVLTLGREIYDLYVWEFVAPKLQQEFGFRIGDVEPGHHGLGIVAVEPGGVFDQAGFRPGDIPVGYVHGFVGFYHHLNSARGKVATVRILRPEDGGDWKKLRRRSVVVPRHDAVSRRPALTATRSPIPVAYALRAKRPRAADESVLPRGVIPCAAYPELGNTVLRLSEGMTAPQRISSRPSDYSTLKGKESTLHGVLFAEVIIDEYGQVSSINILRSISAEFDALFIDEMKSARYRPAKLDGHAVSVCMVYTARPHFR